MRTKVTAALALPMTALLILVLSGPASAHPLGNATINHYDGLVFLPDRIEDKAVEDVAEIPTFQRRPAVDSNSDGRLTDAEAARYAEARCADMATAVTITVNGSRVALAVVRASYVERLGQGSLPAGRLECDLTGTADLRVPAAVGFQNPWDDDGIGWHEITATGKGVTLLDSPFPAESPSDALRAYPDDLLSSPLDVREGTVSTEPGSAASTYRAAQDLPVAGPVVRALDGLSRSVNNKVGQDDLTLGVGVLAVLLAMVVGAGHAFLPGHGKTIMAAYLVGRRGTLRDVVTVGATVTVTHTAGVLLLGLAITTGAALAPATAEKYLGAVSGVIVAAVGAGLLASACRRRATRPAFAPAEVRELVTIGGPAPQGHDHGHGHDHDHESGHGHGYGHDHRHGLGHHSHDHGPSEGGFGRGGLVGLGVAGGLVPSPSALLVLLAAVALGRTSFGILLVLAYGLGMAGALSLAGLLLVRLRGRLDSWAGRRSFARAERWVAALPVLTALLVLTVGTGLAVRALGGGL